VLLEQLGLADPRSRRSSSPALCAEGELSPLAVFGFAFVAC